MPSQALNQTSILLKDKGTFREISVLRKDEGAFTDHIQVNLFKSLTSGTSSCVLWPYEIGCNNNVYDLAL